MLRAGQRFLRSIHRSVSPDDSVDVSESDGIRSLHLGNSTVQSSMRLSDPYALELAYTRGMMAFLLFYPEARNMLMIGLGGGSVPKYIHHYLPSMRSIKVVELNPKVIQIARTLFAVPDNDERLEIIEGDGAQYVRENPDTIQVLMIDAFDSHGIPAELCSQEFFDQCAVALTCDGMMVINLWGSDKNFDVYLLRIEQAFGRRVLILPTGRPGNIVVLAFKRNPAELRWVELREHAKTLERTHKIEFLQFLEKIRDCNPSTAHRLTLEGNL
ncbi:MAG TPA: polyamine aminopropyltransferase [Methylophilaceae bacterium]|nr:polyamine aminopropyltransferase [Methylophilaceae bacterium]